MTFSPSSRTVVRLTFLPTAGCTLIPILNVQGAPYQFDLGFRGIGSGAGCIDATDDGEPDLVGLNLQLDADGQPVQIDRTVIELDGPQATNGATGAIVTSDPAVADLARQISCGQLTMSGDGISLPG